MSSSLDTSIIRNIFNSDFKKVSFSDTELSQCRLFFDNTRDITFNNQLDFDKDFKKYISYHVSKVWILNIYRFLLYKQKVINRIPQHEIFMTTKPTNSISGVNVVTIYTAPQELGGRTGSCPNNCSYCPLERDELGNPISVRSYLLSQPGLLRASSNKFLPVQQTLDRLYSLDNQGHISSFQSGNPPKIELIISGGTFNYYSKSYLEHFVCSAFYAANNYYWFKNHFSGFNYIDDITIPPMKSIYQEQKDNETTNSIRIIGITVETRPDQLIPKNSNPLNPNLNTIAFFRHLGITRVQIGIQHTDQSILDGVNRGCTTLENELGIRILKQNGFKVDIHLMLDLPNSSPIKDISMLREALENPNLSADQVKLYPTEVTPFTEIQEWYRNGFYVPYAETDINNLVRVITYFKENVHPWIRINRVIRDIPITSIEGGVKCSNLRQIIELNMKKNNKKCKCIRCREVKLNKYNPNDCHLYIREYFSSGGTEIFLSYENSDNSILYGFLRLRLNNDWYDTLPELKYCAFIRELHVYGYQTHIGTNDTINPLNSSSQHHGLGKKLIKKAEDFAIQRGFNNIIVISGVGVRDYYRKLGYHDYHHGYLFKNITNSNSYTYAYSFLYYLLFLLIIIIIYYLY